MLDFTSEKERRISGLEVIQFTERHGQLLEVEISNSYMTCEENEETTTFLWSMFYLVGRRISIYMRN